MATPTEIIKAWFLPTFGRLLNKVKLNENDSTEGYLSEKLIAGVNITITEVDGALVIAAGSGENITPVETEFEGAIKLDKYLRDYGTKLVDSNLVVTFDNTGNLDGSSSQIKFKGNGINTLDLSAFTNIDEDTIFDNTNDTINLTIFTRLGQLNFYRILSQYIDVTPSQLNSPTVIGSSLSVSSVRFSWSNITNNSGYKYRVSDSLTFSGAYTTLSANTTQVDISTSVTKYIEVITLGNGGIYLDSDPSTPVSATPSSIVQLAKPVLNTPTVISSTGLQISWGAIANRTSYKLEFSLDGLTGWTQIGDTLIATSYNHTGLTSSTTYYYRITAIGDGVNYSDSDYSDIVNNTTTSTYLRLSDYGTEKLIIDAYDASNFELTINSIDRIKDGSSNIDLNFGLGSRWQYDQANKKIICNYPNIGYVGNYYPVSNFEMTNTHTIVLMYEGLGYGSSEAQFLFTGTNYLNASTYINYYNGGSEPILYSQLIPNPQLTTGKNIIIITKNSTSIIYYVNGVKYTIPDVYVNGDFTTGNIFNGLGGNANTSTLKANLYYVGILQGMISDSDALEIYNLLFNRYD